MPTQDTDETVSGKGGAMGLTLPSTPSTIRGDQTKMNMNVMGIAGQLLMTIGTQLPLLAVWVVGAALAAAHWQRDPRSALFVLLACLVCIFDVIAFGIVYAILPMLLHGGMDVGGFNIRFIYQGLGFVRSCLIAVAWVLVLVAVFRRRSAA